MISMNLFCCWKRCLSLWVTDEWEKCHYSNLNMYDITDAYYMHAKRVCKDFEIKTVGECHDLYLKNDALPLTDVFENFLKMYLEIYQ